MRARIDGWLIKMTDCTFIGVDFRMGWSSFVEFSNAVHAYRHGLLVHERLRQSSEAYRLFELCVVIWAPNWFQMKTTICFKEKCRFPLHSSRIEATVSCTMKNAVTSLESPETCFIRNRSTEVFWLSYCLGRLFSHSDPKCLRRSQPPIDWFLQFAKKMLKPLYMSCHQVSFYYFCHQSTKDRW